MGFITELSKPAVLGIVILLLTCSNIFMTFAWYGNLKFQNYPLPLIILVSWGIAFFEYALQIPANRLGHAYFPVVELKTIQEAITMMVFTFFSIYYLGEPLRWNHFLGFGFIIVGAYAVFYKPS